MDIAVDMDEVIAGYSQEVEETVRVRLPSVRPVPMSERKKFYVVEDYPEEHRKDVAEIAKMPGFYGRLQPVIARIIYRMLPCIENNEVRSAMEMLAVGIRVPNDNGF